MRLHFNVAGVTVEVTRYNTSTLEAFMLETNTRTVTARITGDKVTSEGAIEILLRTSVHPNELLKGNYSRVRAPLNLWLFRNGLFTREPSWVNERGEFLGGDFTLTYVFPSAAEIVAELEQIAVAFPSLNLNVLIFDENKRALGQFTLSEGRAKESNTVMENPLPAAGPANIHSVDAAYRDMGW